MEFDPAAVTTAPIRWATFSAVVLAIGAVAFAHLVLPRVRDGGGLAAAAGRARQLGLWAAAALLPLAAWRLWQQANALRDPGEPAGPMIAALLGSSAWGRGWWLGVAAAGVAIAAFALAARDRWRFAPLLAAPLLAFSPAFTGHAGSTEHLRLLSIGADGVHVLAAGSWLGTLGVLAAIGLPAAARQPDGTRFAAVARLFHAFSPVALWSAATLGATGVVSAWLRLGTPAAVWSSAFGLVLLLKLLCVAAMAALGAWNWKRVTPRLTHDGAVAPARAAVWREVAAGGAVLLVTAVLAATPFPAESQP